MHSKWHRFAVPLSLFIFLLLPPFLDNNFLHESIAMYVQLIRASSSEGSFIAGCRVGAAGSWMG